MSASRPHRVYSITGASLVLGIGFFSSLLTAQVYKWTDAEGRVHYGDQPGNEHAVTIKPTHLKPDADADLMQRQKEQQRLLDAIDAAREKKEKQKAEDKAVQVLRDSNCHKARGRLSGMENSSFLYVKTADPDNPRILTEDEFQAAVDSARHDVEVWCNAGKE